MLAAARPLMRLLALMLTVIVAAQGLAAAQALALGPLHFHAVQAVQDHGHDHGHDHDHDHHHQHDDFEQHHHGPHEAAITVGAAENSFDGGASAALTAFLLPSRVALVRDTRGHVLRAAPAWAWRTAALPLPRKPPRPRG
jgi:ABC-type nickel/cobalt efflux system permease component RcnA